MLFAVRVFAGECVEWFEPDSVLSADGAFGVERDTVEVGVVGDRVRVAGGDTCGAEARGGEEREEEDCGCVRAHWVLLHEVIALL